MTMVGTIEPVAESVEGGCRSCGVLLSKPFRESGYCGDCDQSVPSMLREGRAAMELAQLLWDPVYYGIGVPYGDGSPVLLVPGFLADDNYMAPLRQWLSRLGYQAQSSGIPRNIGCPDRLGRRLIERAQGIVDRSGRRLTIVGHSKGGLMGRGLAATRPDLVHHVIALGAPFRGPLEMDPVTSALATLARGTERSVNEGLVDCFRSECRCGFVRAIADPPPFGVRYTSIYTRTDGVVRWTRCVDEVDECNVEVEGSHFGLAFNSAVYRHLARLLAGYPSPAVT
ncbi:MAG: esterase/lipase family protein [Dehalococcoidia bacterium]